MAITNEPQLKPLTDAMISNLIAVTEDPIDAMRLAADFYAMNAYAADRTRAVASGEAIPEPPTPISAYMRTFTTELKDRLHRIGELLDRRELERLRGLGIALSARMDCGDVDLVEEVFALICLPPAEVVAWLRTHLGELETRLELGGQPS